MHSNLFIQEIARSHRRECKCTKAQDISRLTVTETSAFLHSMDTQSEVVFRIPDTLMYWPWPRKINPHHEEVKAASDAWFRSLNAFGPEAQRYAPSHFIFYSAHWYLQSVWTLQLQYDISSRVAMHCGYQCRLQGLLASLGCPTATKGMQLDFWSICFKVVIPS